MKVLLGVTGSVAAKLTPDLYKQLSEAGHQVKIVATEPSLFFWNQRRKGLHDVVYRDKDEYPKKKYVRNSKILHIELRNWADILVIAPLSANTLAKMANGFADNLLTSVVRAWDRQKPMLVAPAMNTHMLEHPATGEHLATLARWYPNLTVIPTVEKRLACGDIGLGAMASIETILREVAKCAH